MKTCLTILCFGIAFSLSAQLEKGNKLAGVQATLIASDVYNTQLSLSFGSNMYSYGINMVPTFGWVIKRNWVIGAEATLGFLREKEPYPYDKTTFSYFDLGISPYTRIYLDLTQNKKWKLFGLGAVILANRNIHAVTLGSAPGLAMIDDHYSVTLTGSPGGGIAYFGKKLAVDANISNAGIRAGLYKVIQGKRK